MLINFKNYFPQEMQKSGKGQSNEVLNETIQGPKMIPRTLLRIPANYSTHKQKLNSESHNDFSLFEKNKE